MKKLMLIGALLCVALLCACGNSDIKTTDTTNIATEQPLPNVTEAPKLIITDESLVGLWKYYESSIVIPELNDTMKETIMANYGVETYQEAFELLKAEVVGEMSNASLAVSADGTATMYSGTESAGTAEWTVNGTEFTLNSDGDLLTFTYTGDTLELEIDDTSIFITIVFKK